MTLRRLVLPAAGLALLGWAWRRRSTSVPDGPPPPPPRGDHPGWHRSPLASLDLEATGVDPATDRIVSYALLGDGGGDITGLVDPGVPVPEQASQVHGLTDAVLAGATSPTVALTLIVEWLQSLVDRRIGLVVFNATYDLTLIRAEADRWGVAQPDWDRLLVVDPYVLGWGIEPRRRGARRLVDVAERYGVRLDHAHDATADARAARDVAFELGARHRSIAVDSLDELMRLQRGWYADRAEDWNAYAATRDKPLDDPHGWPLAAHLVR